MGANWRADVWTVLEQAPNLSAAEAARRAGCSFATAWQVVQDFALLRSSRTSSTE
jgi:molybdenum-dependent DNA-binding transcriptional regulator ModE